MSDNTVAWLTKRGAMIDYDIPVFNSQPSSAKVNSQLSKSKNTHTSITHNKSLHLQRPWQLFNDFLLTQTCLLKLQITKPTAVSRDNTIDI